MTDPLAGLVVRVQGNAAAPTLIYLPGLHGDWTLAASFRASLQGRARLVEITYPRRVDWQLSDYARAVLAMLREHHISSGWLLGESFGSQIVWKIVEGISHGAADFRPAGIILAGGFVRHPIMWGVRCFHRLHRCLPFPVFRALLKVYAGYARFRHRHAPETRAGVSEFLQRRTREDLAAIGSRYPLIVANDPRTVAHRTTVPVYQLAGGIDPIVPWASVRRWLRRHCPGYRASRIIPDADHNVLGTAPATAAAQVMEWMAAN